MTESQSGSKDLLDTSDYLEAIGVFKGWKNLFFVLTVLCLLLLQASFWVVDRGYIPISDEADDSAGTGTALAPKTPQPSEPTGLAAVDPNQHEPGPSQTNEPNQSIGQDQKNQSEAKSNELSGFSSSNARIQRAVAWPSGNFLSGFTFQKLAVLIRFLNAVLVLTATLYCLTLLFGLKISMHARLGGINHISKAFFLSLFTLVLLLPWQDVFGNMIIGAIYSPGELVQWSSKEAGHTFDRVLYYLRFTGFGALLLLLFIFSQIRSARWAKAIFRRIDIL